MKDISIEEPKMYLPIGSIVLLKNNFTMYMISGYVNKNENGKINDYMGVPYPYGLISFDSLYFFDHKDIEEVLYIGYKDKDYEFLNKILNSKDKL